MNSSSPIHAAMQGLHRIVRSTSWRGRMGRHVLPALAAFILAVTAAHAQGTWVPSGLQDVGAGLLARDAQGNMLATSPQGVFRSGDHGYTWTPASLTEDVRALAMTPDGTGLAMFFSLEQVSDMLARSTDKGVTWTSGSRPGYAKGLKIDGQGRPVIMQADHLQRSEDGGATWKTLGREGFTEPFFDFRHLAIGPDSLMVLGNGGITGGLVFASTDNGRNWRQIYDAGGDMVMIEVAPSGTIFVARPGSFVRSSDLGDSWTDVTGATGMIISMAFHGNDIYAATLTSLYHSSDDGVTWTSIPRGSIPDDAVIATMMTDTDGDLLVATSAGIYRRDAAASVNVVWNTTAFPSIHPHPVRALAVMELPAPARKELRFEVFDLLGHSQGMSSTGGPGMSSFTLDASGLAAGIYLIRLEVDGAASTRTMVVAR